MRALPRRIEIRTGTECNSIRHGTFGRPPARLRTRIAKIFAATAPPKRLLFWKLGFAGALAAIVLLSLGLVLERRARRADQLQADIDAAAAGRMFRAVNIIRASGTREVPFGDMQREIPSGKMF